jgi:hypothetical protein
MRRLEGLAYKICSRVLMRTEERNDHDVIAQALLRAGISAV